MYPTFLLATSHQVKKRYLIGTHVLLEILRYLIIIN